MLYPPMTTIQLTKLHYSIKANKYQVAVLYLYYRPVAKSEFIYFSVSLHCGSLNVFQDAYMQML
jgi:hypothetical protein